VNKFLSQMLPALCRSDPHAANPRTARISFVEEDEGHPDRLGLALHKDHGHRDLGRELLGERVPLDI
jgi:hypothetical protein